MLTEDNRTLLLQVARQSLQKGIETRNPLLVDALDYDDELRQKRATFVTLKSEQRLRGCIGLLEARRPLVEDVAYNAFAAGFRDSRFAPLEKIEIAELEISISVLQPSTAMQFENEADLIRQLVPGRDGLILGYQQRRGTFLPAVWEDLRDPAKFLTHLKTKAGLAPDFWADDLWVHRYTTESFSDQG